MPQEHDYKRTSDSMLHDHIAAEEKKFEEFDERFDSLETRLAVIEKGVTDIIEAYAQAKGALSFIKILATIAASFAGIYAFITGNFSITPK